MKLRTLVALSGMLALAAGRVSAQGFISRRGGIPGGMLSARPGIGGLAVPGQVPGGTLATQPGMGGVGVPRDVPGGTLGAASPCGLGPCTRVLFIPGLTAPVPGAPVDDGASVRADGAAP
jgi:hypothetical protein